MYGLWPINVEAESVEKLNHIIRVIQDNCTIITIVIVQEPTWTVTLPELIVGIRAERQLVDGVLNVFLTQHIANEFSCLTTVIDSLNILNYPGNQIALK